ncbi:hypothetical protein NLJ89_g7407 [Agrocybe chaxingu]|uniref:Uncharacterized protein n=1 Tax=Agrocybe chaxingu TaxID=84603 RepID=A0A9W8JWV9_9AGAR|nr:hypothetical protein NLJ89_g7407 [Agrocybe chaxingu]
MVWLGADEAAWMDKRGVSEKEGNERTEKEMDVLGENKWENGLLLSSGIQLSENLSWCSRTQHNSVERLLPVSVAVIVIADLPIDGYLDADVNIAIAAGLDEAGLDSLVMDAALVVSVSGAPLASGLERRSSSV